MRYQYSNLSFVKQTAVLFVLLCCSAVAAQTVADSARSAASPAVLRSVDTAFSMQSADDLRLILQQYTGAVDYAELETYTLKKIRQYVVYNKLDFARAASLILVDCNIDNGDAAALYASISRAVFRRDERFAFQQEQERLLIEKREADAAAVPESPYRNYQPVANSSSGKIYYYNSGGVYYSPFEWYAQLGLADFLMSAGDNEIRFKYGLSVGGSVFYYGSFVAAGLDVFADIMLLDFSGLQDMAGSVKIISAVALPALTDRVFLRAGFYGSPDFLSPAVGIGFRYKTENLFRFEGFGDYYPGHLMYESVSAAFEAGAAVSIPFVEGDIMSIGMKIGLSDEVFIKTSGVENNVKCVFSIGVGN